MGLDIATIQRSDPLAEHDFGEKRPNPRDPPEANAGGSTPLRHRRLVDPHLRLLTQHIPAPDALGSHGFIHARANRGTYPLGLQAQPGFAWANISS